MKNDLSYFKYIWKFEFWNYFRSGQIQFYLSLRFDFFITSATLPFNLHLYGGKYVIVKSQGEDSIVDRKNSLFLCHRVFIYRDSAFEVNGSLCSLLDYCKSSIPSAFRTGKHPVRCALRLKARCKELYVNTNGSGKICCKRSREYKSKISTIILKLQNFVAAVGG